MKKSLVILFICIGVFFCSAFLKSPHQVEKNKIDYADTLAKERQKYTDQVLESVKDKQDMACDSVFKNIHTFTGKQAVKVTHFLAIMNYWGEALGVSCTYCHQTSDWASDNIKQKQIARDMFAMRVKINDEILPNIKNLHSDPARVNCGTCHKGKPYPEE